MKIKYGKKEINSLLVAIYICETVICSMIDSIIHIQNISFWVMVIILFSNAIVNKAIYAFRIKRGARILLILEILLVLSAVGNGMKYVTYYGSYLLVFGLTALVLSYNNIDFGEVIHNISIIYILYYII